MEDTEEDTDSRRLFCFGLGYTARALADELLAAGWTVAGTCRTDDKRATLRARGIEAFAFDRGRPLEDPAGALTGVTHLLSSVPPDAAGDAVITRLKSLGRKVHRAARVAGVRPRTRLHDVAVLTVRLTQTN